MPVVALPRMERLLEAPSLLVGFIASMWLDFCSAGTMYTYAAIFAAQNIAIAQLGEHWIQNKPLEALVYFSLLPILLLFINLAGVLVSAASC